MFEKDGTYVWTEEAADITAADIESLTGIDRCALKYIKYTKDRFGGLVVEVRPNGNG